MCEVNAVCEVSAVREVLTSGWSSRSENMASHSSEKFFTCKAKFQIKLKLLSQEKIVCHHQTCLLVVVV